MSPRSQSTEDPRQPKIPVSPRSQSALDIVFLPVVGWDRRGGRLGMGGGYYDRTLANISGPLLVGLAHDGQQVDDIPRESWDVALDYVATDTDLYSSTIK